MEVVPTEEQVEILLGVSWRDDARTEIFKIMDRDEFLSTEDIDAEMKRWHWDRYRSQQQVREREEVLMRQTREMWAEMQRDAEWEYRWEQRGPKATLEQLEELTHLAAQQKPPEQIRVERCRFASHAHRKQQCLIYPLVHYEERSGLERMSKIQRDLGPWCRKVEAERQRLEGQYSFRELALKLEEAGLTPGQRLAQIRIPSWEAVVAF